MTEFICELCKKDFSCKRSLDRHVKNKTCTEPKQAGRPRNSGGVKNKNKVLHQDYKVKYEDMKDMLYRVLYSRVLLEMDNKSIKKSLLTDLSVMCDRLKSVM